MHWGTDLYLKLLGVGELVENAGAVLEDWLLRGRRRPPAGLQGSTAIVTGGNAGVGLATAEALLRHGAGTVVLACRSQERGAAAAARLAAAVGGAGERVQVEALDLADLSSVRAFARRWADSGRPLDLLVLNAGECAVVAGCERCAVPAAAGYTAAAAAINAAAELPSCASNFDSCRHHVPA